MIWETNFYANGNEQMRMELNRFDWRKSLFHMQINVHEHCEIEGKWLVCTRRCPYLLFLCYRQRGIFTMFSLCVVCVCFQFGGFVVIVWLLRIMFKYTFLLRASPSNCLSSSTVAIRMAVSGRERSRWQYYIWSDRRSIDKQIEKSRDPRIHRPHSHRHAQPHESRGTTRNY